MAVDLDALAVESEQRTVIVQVNRVKVYINPGRLRTTELFAIAGQYIPENYDVWRVVSGAPDERVGEWVEATHGLRLFSCPRFINNSVQPAVPVDAIARLVAMEEARAAIEWGDRYYAARDAIQPTDCETVRAWLETIKGAGE